jgi:hypothetical protein
VEEYPNSSIRLPLMFRLTRFLKSVKDDEIITWFSWKVDFISSNTSLHKPNGGILLSIAVVIDGSGTHGATQPT